MCVAVNDILLQMKTLVANLDDTCTACNMVVALNLGNKLCLDLYHHNGQSLPVNAFADGGYIVSLCRIIELKIYRVVHVSELVNVVKTYLERHHVAIIITSFFCHLC